MGSWARGAGGGALAVELLRSLERQTESLTASKNNPPRERFPGGFQAAELGRGLGRPRRPSPQVPSGQDWGGSNRVSWLARGSSEDGPPRAGAGATSFVHSLRPCLKLSFIGCVRYRPGTVLWFLFNSLG